MGVPLYVICNFFLIAFHILFVFNFHHYDWYFSQCVPPWVYPAWASLCFLVLFDYFLSHVREVSAIISSNIFSHPFPLYSPSRTTIMWMLMHLMLSQRSLMLSSFFFLSFFYILFCISDFQHPVLQVTYPFICISYSAIDSGLPDSSAGKNLPAMQETLGRFLGQEDPLEKG